MPEKENNQQDETQEEVKSQQAEKQSNEEKTININDFQEGVEKTDNENEEPKKIGGYEPEMLAEEMAEYTKDIFLPENLPENEKDKYKSKVTKHLKFIFTLVDIEDLTSGLQASQLPAWVRVIICIVFTVAIIGLNLSKYGPKQKQLQKPEQPEQSNRPTRANAKMNPQPQGGGA